jgi:hypothetical protein
MYLAVQIIIIIAHLKLSFEDLKSFSFRSLWLFILLPAFLYQGITVLGTEIYGLMVVRNILIIVLMLLISLGVLSLISKKEIGSMSVKDFRKYIGNGDIWMLLVLSFAMQLKIYLIVLIASSILSLVYGKIKYGKLNSKIRIPYAAFMGICMTTLVIFEILKIDLRFEVF